MQEISQNIIPILNSRGWLTATEEIVQDILQLDDLDVSETALFRAIENWGKAQIKTGGNLSELRKAVDSSIKLVRFMCMENSEFATLCISSDLLSIQEKYSIFLSISKSDPKYMPENFDRSKLTRRTDQRAIIYNTSCTPLGVGVNFDESFRFSVNKSVTLLGLEIVHIVEYDNSIEAQMFGGGPYSSFGNMEFTVLDTRDVTIIAMGNTSNITKINGKDIIFISKPIVLQKDIKYDIRCRPSSTPDYFYQIISLNTSESLINYSTGHVQNHTLPTQSSMQPRLWELGHHQYRQGTREQGSAGTCLVQGEITQRGRGRQTHPPKSERRLFSMFAHSAAWDAQFEVPQLDQAMFNLQIHGNASFAPIVGFVINP